MIGKTLAHYRIEAKIGEGGMGVVYRAFDMHLDRLVAIKVLRPDAITNLERKRRFVQEAKSASALNHPNIIHIYDIDVAACDEGNIDYIAMEFVSGRTLDHYLRVGGLSLKDTLRYAIPIADALARAHDAGIIHRDIKPANIMVGDDGRVKLLDFGLAKLTEHIPEDDTGETATIAHETEQGTVLGTLAYMSPEQVEGRKLDARSDIFSFGSLVYEMVTGQRPFHGATRMATLSSILNAEPRPPSEIAQDLPAELEKIISRCLRKDRERRTQHIGDVRLALEELKEESESGKLTHALRARTMPRHVWILACVGIVSAVVALALWTKNAVNSDRTSPAAPLTRLTSDSGLTTHATLSPDGKLLAYASDRSGEGNLDIWAQQLAGGEAIQLTRHAGDDHEPSFSPDGSKIVFRSERDGGGVYVVSTLGGQATLLARDGRRPRFSPDAKHIAYWVGRFSGDLFNRGTGRIYVIPSAGGRARQIQSDFLAARYPVWLPDSRHILSVGTHPNASGDEPWDWWISPLDEGQPVKTGAASAFKRQNITAFVIPAFWGGERGGILASARLADSTNIWHVPISATNWRITNDPVRVTFGSGFEDAPSGATETKLAFASLNRNVDVWTLPVDASQAKVAGALTRITTDASEEGANALSADGKNLVLRSTKFGNSDIFVRDLLTGRQIALTATEENEDMARFSSDGTRVGFIRRDRSSGQWPLYVVPASGGLAEKIFDDCRYWNWSPDTKKIAHVISPPPTIYVFNTESREDVEYLKHPRYNLYMPSFSPDGQWIGFTAGIDGNRARLYVVRYRDRGPIPETDWIPITDGSALDEDVNWSPDGASIYYKSDRHGFTCLWNQRLDAATKKPVGSPVPVYDFHTARLSFVSAAVTRDKIAMTLIESIGNIWMTSRSPQH